MNRQLSRRKLLVLGGSGLAAAATSAKVASAVYDGTAHGRKPFGLNGTRMPGNLESTSTRPVRALSLAGTDGWASMPVGSRPVAPYFPDIWAEENTDTYTFGFREVTGLTQDQVTAQQGHVQISAPIIEVNADEELWVTLANIGLVMRPDLADSHTMHWHGFRNAIPFFDGVPETSISVPIGRQFTYAFRPASEDAGTYMYHCHFEDVEHVTMGMTGVLFVRPDRTKYIGQLNTTRNIVPRAYDDKASGTIDTPYETKFDREYSILLTEIDSRAHFNDAHILLTDWTDYRPNFWLMNGRAYPDTIAPNAPFDTSGNASSNPNFGKPARDADGTLTAPVGAPHLKNQPMSSRIVARPGDKVLIRVVNLGFEEQSLVLPGIEMRTVGSDARALGPDRQTKSDTVSIGPGESRDVIIIAPTAPGEYPLYNRDVSRYPGVDPATTDAGAINAGQWLGGQRTVVEVRSGVPAQRFNNEWRYQ